MLLKQGARPKPPPPGPAESALIRQLLAENARTERLLEPELENMRRMVRELKPVLATVLALQRSPDLQLALQTFTDPGLFDELRAATLAWERETQPGAFLGDVLIATGNDPARAAAAIERLAPYFTWGVLFHPDRAVLLAEPLGTSAAEAEVTQNKTRLSLTVTALWFVLRDPSFWSADPQGKFYSLMRRRVRAEVERALLDGLTLDQQREIAVAPDDLPEDPYGLDVDIEALFFEREYLRERIEQMMQRLAPILATLTPREREAVEGTETDGASRTARSRAVHKVREALARM